MPCAIRGVKLRPVESVIKLIRCESDQGCAMSDGLDVIKSRTQFSPKVNQERARSDPDFPKKINNSDARKPIGDVAG
jgi:hypothetical protein